MACPDAETLGRKLARIESEADGIAETTGCATDDILAACERLLPGLNPAQRADVQKIMESCAVQDLTNQRLMRIRRVIGQINGTVPDEDDPLLDGPQRQGDGMSQDAIDSMFDTGK